MELSLLMPHVEALVFASERPLSLLELTDYLGQALEVPLIGKQVEAALEAIEEKYGADFYPFGLVQTGGGYQFLTKPDFHRTVLQLNGDKHIKKLSTSALETLAIIAYKQPVTKGDIEGIRGVSADYSIQKLLEKELIVIAGRDEESVGKPLIYATSRHFMDYLGINSPAELPPLRELALPETAEPTAASEAVPEDAIPSEPKLMVAEDGSLQGDIDEVGV
jgi:segregation and condensation protein B